jgi:RNA polymerase sigma factor (sigma-70 family)
MDVDPRPFQDLMRRVPAGDAEAVAQLVREYSCVLHHFIRRALDARRTLRRFFDSDDVMQEIWADFLEDVPRRPHFELPQGLEAYLVRMARNFVENIVAKYLDAQKRDLRRDVPLEGAAEPSIRSFVGALLAQDEFDNLLRAQAPKLREALCLLRDGHTQQEAARRLGISPRTLSRMLQHAKDRKSRTA